MMIEISEKPLSFLADYSLISIAYEVTSILELGRSQNDLDGFILHERRLIKPYTKDYDSIKGNHPTDWPRKFDMANWGMLTANVDSKLVGGALIAFKTENFYILENRSDLAVLWDLRVSPQWRGEGIGSTLFERCMKWAKSRGCCQLKIETQNINVAACKFYQSHGCELGTINRFAYPELPDEIQLLWYKSL
jgi:GNAT superfamily N-acetyltransferase